MSLTPENSSSRWPSFGERFKREKDSAHRWMNFGAQVTDPEPVLKFLYGTVRSGHFHAGEFPLGEYDLLEFHRGFMSSAYTENTNLRRKGFEVTREAIVNWLTARLP